MEKLELPSQRENTIRTSIESHIDSLTFEKYTSPYSLKLLAERGITKEGETFNDVLKRVLTANATIDENFKNSVSTEDFIKDIARLLDEGKIILGTPILTYAGKLNRTPSACTVIPVDLNQGKEAIKSTITPYYQNAMGSGFDFTRMEDPVSLLRLLNDITREIEGTCDRPVASMGTLHCTHPKIFDFIDSKREEDFSDWRFNISVLCTDDFMKAVIENDVWRLTNQNGDIVDEFPARKLFRAIAESAHYCGEPGVLFKDRFEMTNPTPELQYESAAPCAEVAMAPGEVCQFSYINIGQCVKKDGEKYAVDYNEIKVAVEQLVRFLDNNTELSINNAVSNSDIIAAKRRIGVGISGLADLLIKLETPYSSEQSRKIVDTISSIIQFYSKQASIELAGERGAFKLFDKSRYVDKDWFLELLGPKTDVVSEEMKNDLWEKMSNYGIRHSGTTAIPPSGTSSRLVEASPSIEPLFSLVLPNGELHKDVESLLRKYIDDEEWHFVESSIKRTGKISPHVKIPQKIREILRVATELSTDDNLNILHSAQEYVDESVSKTFNMPNNATVEDVYSLLLKAYHYDLKGVAVFRDGCLQEIQEKKE